MICKIIPGIAVVKAPEIKAAQVKAELVMPEKTIRTIPQMILPTIMADIREM